MSSLFLDYRISLVGSAVVNAVGTNPNQMGQDSDPAVRDCDDSFRKGARVSKGTRVVLLALGAAFSLALLVVLSKLGMSSPATGSSITGSVVESVVDWWAQQKQQEQRIYKNVGKAVKRTFFGSSYDKSS